MKGLALTERNTLCLVVLALVAVTVTGCGDGPKRNKEHHTYPEYKAAALGLDYGEEDEGAGGAVDDGEFGPASGALITAQADVIVGAQQAGAGSLKGSVAYAGAVKPRKRLDLSKDKWCSGNHEVLSEGLVVNGGKIRDVVVYISRGFNRFDFECPTTPARLNQDGCKYIPHVLTLMANQELVVQNSDMTSHNYHFIGTANDEINKTQPKPTEDSVFSLTSPELGASFRCDVHGWMFAPTHIFSHPYYAVTDESGQFEIKNIPPGTYEVSFLHERKSVKYAPQTITVAAGNATEITVQ